MQKSNQRVILSTAVILQKVVEEDVLLNLKTAQYYSLDTIGLHMLELITGNPSIELGFSGLLEEYAVESEVLRSDMQELIDTLIKQEILEIV